MDIYGIKSRLQSRITGKVTIYVLLFLVALIMLFTIVHGDGKAVNTLKVIFIKSFGDLVGLEPGNGILRAEVDIKKNFLKDGDKASTSDLSYSLNEEAVSEHITDEDPQINSPNKVLGVVSDTPSRETSLPECDISKAEPFLSPVIISEVAWMGSQEFANNEWLEIKNRSEYRANIGGWMLVNTPGNIEINVPAGTSIGPDEYLIFERNSDDVVPDVLASAIYSGALSNSGAKLMLLNENCGLADEVDATGGWPAGDNKSKQTMERTADGIWQSSRDPGGSPGEANSVVIEMPESEEVDSLDAPPQAPKVTPSLAEEEPLVPDTSDSENSRDELSIVPEPELEPEEEEPKNEPEPEAGNTNILISEIFYDAEGGDGGKEFIELYNAGSEEVSLAEWKIKKDDKNIVTIGSKSEDNALVSSGGYFLIGLSGYSGDPSADVVRSAGLPNTTATISLLAPNTTVIDQVAYTESVSPGQSLERASWDSAEFRASSPSPGGPAL